MKKSLFNKTDNVTYFSYQALLFKKLLLFIQLIENRLKNHQEKLSQVFKQKHLVKDVSFI